MVATERMPEIATATLGVWVGTGSRNEQPHEHGLSHLIEHMAFKGTARRSARQIAEDIENVGGDINAATSVEYTSYTARVLGENVDVALDVLGDILINSVFDPAELAREKGVILQEYAAVEDTPDDLDLRRLHGNAPLRTSRSAGRSSARPTPSRAFDEATIRAFLAREYTPGQDGARRRRRRGSRADRRGGRAPFRRHAAGRVQRSLKPANIRAASDGSPPARTGEPRARPAGPVLQGPGYYRGPSLRPHARRRADLPPLARGARDPRPRLFHRLLPLALLRLRPVRHRRRNRRDRTLRELMEVTLDCMRQAIRNDISEIEMLRAKAQMKVALLTALETPGGRIERMARQLLSWGRMIPSEEIVAKVDALTVGAGPRRPGAGPPQGAPTIAAIGPIKGLPSIAKIARGAAGLNCAGPLRGHGLSSIPPQTQSHCPLVNR